MLYPYIELKNNGGYTEAQIQGIVDMVNEYGLKGKVSYISFSDTYLNYVKAYDPEARLGYITSSPNTNYVTYCRNLQTETNEVFFDPKVSNMTNEIYEAFADAGIPVEVWTINSTSAILGMNPYITGVTSDSLIAGKILYDANI